MSSFAAFFRKWAFLTSILLLASSASWAGALPISEREFRALAEELAPKVNLFRETWKVDPQAEFYGGTTRDYLFWLKGKFRGVEDRSRAKQVIDELRAMPVIDVRQFIIGESDVDIVSKQSGLPPAQRFGVRKIDALSPEIFDSSTELGKNELNQGHIPAEKIRLARDGFKSTSLGDGIGEIYRGKLSVQFADPKVFMTTKYAQEGVNHPVLLGLRYLRLQAIRYFQEHGEGYPDKAKLMEGIDEVSHKKVRAVIASVSDGKALKPYFKQDRFKSWFNGSIQKAFRSYTNPTAAFELMREFGVQRLSELYPEVEPLNQYVFAKYRDEKAIQAALRKYKVDADSFYESPSKYFSDGFLYHGTTQEEFFRNILFQGVLASEDGSGGAGLYGVAKKNIAFAENWAQIRGGDRERVVRFPVRSEARLVNITGKREGKRVWDLTRGLHKGNYEKFSEMFGIDIVKYPYHAEAFVVKNSSVLGRAEGVYRKLLTFPELIKAAKSENDPRKLMSLLSINFPDTNELDLVWKESPIREDQILEMIQKRLFPKEVVEYVLGAERWRENPRIIDAVYQWAYTEKAPGRQILLDTLLPSRSVDVLPQSLPVLAKLFVDPKEKLPAKTILSLAAIFSDRKYISEAVTEKFIGLLETTPAKWKKDHDRLMLAYSFGYLSEVKISESQSARLFKQFQIQSPTSVRLAKVLLFNDHRKSEVRSKLETYMKKFPATSQDGDAIHSLEILMHHFPKDTALEERAITLMNAHSDIDLYETFVPLIKKNTQRMKKILIDGAARVDERLMEDKRRYIGPLAGMKLSRSELVTILDQPGSMISTPALMDNIAANFELDAEMMRKIMNAFLEIDERDTAPNAFFEYFSKLSKKDDGILTKVLADIIRAEDPNSRDSGFKMANIYTVLTKRRKPIPHFIQSEILGYLGKEKEFHTNFTRAVTELINSEFDLKNKSISKQVQRIYVRADDWSNDHIALIADQMDDWSPEYEKFLKKSLKLSKNADYRNLPRDISAVLKKRSSDCADRYGALK